MEKKYFTTNAKNGYRVCIRSTDSALVTTPNGSVKMQTKRGAIYLDIKFEEKLSPAEAAKKLNEKNSCTDITAKEITDILLDKQKTSTVLWEWKNRPGDKVKKSLENQLESEKAEKETLKKQLEQYKKDLDAATKPKPATDGSK